jgi:hypothetical protein
MESMMIENAVRGVDHRERNGMEFLVAPVVALRSERVRSGYIPTREIERAQTAWNGTAITLDGPTNSANDPISLNTPRKADEYRVGTLFSTSVEDGSLVGEAWILVDRDLATNRFDEARELVDRLEGGEEVSVSSSFHANQGYSGEYDGEMRSKVIETLNPDHIALLLGRSEAQVANSERTDSFPSNIVGERITQLENQ